MTMATVRLAMMNRFSDISGVIVPPDPLPLLIDDKTIVVFPRSSESSSLSKGSARGAVAITSDDVLQIEYHRRIPYEHLGSTFGDVTNMIDTISTICWSEHAGGKFDGEVFAIRGVSLVHFGALGWNEWTFGARLEVAFSYLANVTS
jgi:hypothetical protein